MSLCKGMWDAAEYNLAGAAYNHSMHQEAYPHHAFWEVAAEVGNTAIIGVDAHDPRALMSDDLREEGLRFLHSLGMTITDETAAGGLPCAQGNKRS